MKARLVTKKAKEIKQKEQKIPPLNSFISSVIKVEDIENNRYVKTHNGYFCLLKISGIDIFHFSEPDQHSVFRNFAKAEGSVKLPHKYVFMDSKPNLQEQKDFMRYKLEKTTDEFKCFLLERQIDNFEILEQDQRDRLAYLLIFSDNTSDLENTANSYIFNMSDTAVEYCEDVELSTAVSSILKFSLEHDTATNAEKLQNIILPNGLELSQSYFMVGDQYVTSLMVYDYPSYISDLLFANILNQSGITSTLDVIIKPKKQVVKEIKSSLDELRSRRVINQSTGDSVIGEAELDDLTELFVSIQRGNEQILSTTLRFFITADTLIDLKKRTGEIMSDLEDEGISVTIPQNEMEQEFKSLLCSSDVIGNPIPLHETFSTQFPFYYQNYIDNTGTYVGETTTGGQLILDTFKKTSSRTSYDIVLTGVKGSGKTVTLEAMAQDINSLGNKVMIMDIEGDYIALARKLGGKIIKLGKQPLINPLEFRRTVVELDDDDNEPKSNYVSEISRITTFMYQYIPSLSEMEAEEFKAILQRTYSALKIDENTDINSLSPTDFPIFTDVLKQLRNRLYSRYINEDDYEFISALTDNRKNVLGSLEIYIKQIAEGMYASIFNGYSSIDITKEDFIVFDVKDLSEMEERVYNAQLFNILSLMWGEICDNKIINKKLKNQNDRKYVVAIIDEAHRFINAKNPQALNFILNLVRRTRKYDAALWFASQSILDFVPNYQSEHVDTIKTIFALVQYKIILAQPTQNIELAQVVFPQFTVSELVSSTIFKPGEMLLSLGGGRHKIHCCRYIPKQDFAYFGNSRDVT